jgi:hypothetical protein
MQEICLRGTPNPDCPNAAASTAPCVAHSAHRSETQHVLGDVADEQARAAAVPYRRAQPMPTVNVFGAVPLLRVLAAQPDQSSRATRSGCCRVTEEPVRLAGVALH